MWSWARFKQKSPPANEAEQFHREVEACAKAMNRQVLKLTERYSVPAMSVALAMHLNVALRACVRRGEVTEEQARLLAQRLVDPAFSGEEMERSFGPRAGGR